MLSTISGHKLEDVKAGSSGPVFYQLYLMGGRAAAEAVMERARVAGFAGLVVTIDTPVSGIRERDYRNGMKELISGSLLEKIPFLPQILSRPGWLISFLLDGGLPALPNVVIPGKGPMPLVDINAALARSAVTWADLRWIRDCWRGPIVIKGVLTGDDARRAIDAGAAAISVSNHGGRQTASRPRCEPCQRWSARSTVRSRYGWTAVFAAAPISSRHCASGLARSSVGARMPMALPHRAKQGSREPLRYCALIWSAPYGCSVVLRRPPWIGHG